MQLLAALADGFVVNLDYLLGGKEVIVALGDGENQIQIGELQLRVGGLKIGTAFVDKAAHAAEVEQELRDGNSAKKIVRELGALRSVAVRQIVIGTRYARKKIEREVIGIANPVVGRAQILRGSINLRQQIGAGGAYSGARGGPVRF